MMDEVDEGSLMMAGTTGILDWCGSFTQMNLSCGKIKTSSKYASPPYAEIIIHKN